MSWTRIVYQFHGHEAIIINLPTYVINQWIDEKKPIHRLRVMGTVLSFREYNKS